jgi:hypothetical protein
LRSSPFFSSDQVNFVDFDNDSVRAVRAVYVIEQVRQFPRGPRNFPCAAAASEDIE